ncbi:hypothetical protein CERZMDRAFT_90521 [Cercospora zeae-maydis SCOH1-5]|uniref:Uncharacterized protein n=1 Tax=Cercospora zeae-maydis SCOH1-5 TaxID=717836 RepID=A0A6A6FJX7_9PEZI|nr:hypothetical protein CERZMDRAFT_90521 [Cercospora zeae-maydis SCOH1-5]
MLLAGEIGKVTNLRSVKSSVDAPAHILVRAEEEEEEFVVAKRNSPVGGEKAERELWGCWVSLHFADGHCTDVPWSSWEKRT